MQRYIVGIDEVGRGPLAGPVTVGACVIKKPAIIPSLFPLKDSKQLSQRMRGLLYKEIQKVAHEGIVFVTTASVSAQTIDRVGITRSIEQAINRVLKNVIHKNDLTADMLKLELDGGLRASSLFQNQETIVRGDQNHYAIALASIVAKVRRDALMQRYSQHYPHYGFAAHKGYGSKAHREAIKRWGLSPLHRKTFCKGSLCK